MNVVSLMGRITADPELKKTPNNISVCSFSLAVDKYTNGERKANFINCVAWRTTAEFICKHFKKGSQLALIGEIQTRTYQDKDGKNRTAFEVLANNVFFAGGGSSNNSNNVASERNETEQNGEGFATVNNDDGDLPF